LASHGQALRKAFIKKIMNTSHPFDLVIGLDRSDCKADLYLIDTHSGKTEKQLLNTSPEALHQWLAKLRQQNAEAKVAPKILVPGWGCVPTTASPEAKS
jgi:hypothetical protein